MQQDIQELTAEQVRALIEHIYCRKYVGTIELKKLVDAQDKPYGYMLSLGLGCSDRPLQIAFDGTPAQFLKLLEKRLRQDHIADTEFSYGIKGYSASDMSNNPHDKSCSQANYTKVPNKFYSVNNN